jgi:hypothetical protein
MLYFNELATVSVYILGLYTCKAWPHYPILGMEVSRWMKRVV